MWPLILVGLLFVGAAAAKKKKTGGEQPGPLEEEPSPTQTAAEAAQAAKDALDAASAGAAQGTPEGAAQANDALDKAADAAAAAQGTSAADIVTQIAKQVEDIAKQAAAQAGVPPPETKSPERSPGLPPIKAKPEPEQPTVVVEPEPKPGEPIPPPPTATLPTLPTTPPTTLEEAKQQAEEVLKQLPIPVPVSTPTEKPPLATEETTPELDPNGTIALARMLLDREQTPGWREALQGQVMSWQRKLKLTPDGKFGPGSALKMGTEVGVLPLIRFWPKSQPSKSRALQKYRDNVHTLAANLESQGKKEHAKALDLSADFEDARAFGNPNAKPVTNEERIAQVAALAKAVA